MIKTQKLEFVGHIKRNSKRYNIVQNGMQRKIPEKHEQVRRRIS